MNQHTPELILDSANRFWSYVDKTGPGECWTYRGVKDHDGYGRFTNLGRMYGAHRVAFCLFGGSLPNGAVVRHSCDNPSCVNPAHLKAGTHAENSADRDSRNRQAKGERNGRAKLTAETVLAIREAYVPRKVSAPKLAVRFGVNVHIVRDIINGKTWRHVAARTHSTK